MYAYVTVHHFLEGMLLFYPSIVSRYEMFTLYYISRSINHRKLFTIQWNLFTRQH
jgi:hypothetical protein